MTEEKCYDRKNDTKQEKRLSLQLCRGKEVNDEKV